VLKIINFDLIFAEVGYDCAAFSDDFTEKEF
jgi:hypothetical protein